MNKENIIEYIKAPELLEQGNLDFLKQVVNEFPFFQTSRLLLLKTLQNIDSVTFENELQLTAVHVPNRKKIYFLLHPDVRAEVSGTENIGIDNDISHENETDNAPEIKKDLLSGIISKRLAEIKEGKVKDNTGEPDDFRNRPGKDFEHIADVILQKAAESKKVKKGVREASLNMQESEPLDVDPNLLEIDETEKTAPDITAKNIEDYATGGKKVAQNKELLQIENEEEEISTTHYDKSMELLFFHKLNILDLKLPSEIFTEEEDEGEEEDLIEKFIKNNPTIDRKIPLETPVGHEDFSVESIKETEEYLTDTLANIYIKQGNYSKAILAYEKLSLKYPEKSTYFADQINKIKELIKKL